MKIKDCHAGIEFDGDMVGRIVLEVKFEKGDHVSRSIDVDCEEARRRSLQLAKAVFVTIPGDELSGPSLYIWDGS